MRFSKTKKQHIDEPNHRIFKPKKIRTPRFRARRLVFWGTLLITLLFGLKLFLGLFDFKHVHVNIILQGNSHYTEGHVYDVLGENLHNIITDSEAKTTSYLMENLSYVKDTSVSKNYAKRQLSIEITERKPYARVKHIHLPDAISDDAKHLSDGKLDDLSLYLIDEAGFVLESISEEDFQHMPLIIDEGKQIPSIGKQMKSGTIHRSIQIMKHVRTRHRVLSKNLKSVDARISDKIIIELDNLPTPVWIASDMIETGLHHVDLFIQQKGILILKQKMQMAKEKQKTMNRTRNKVIPLHEKYTYLDGRYEDTLFLGGTTDRWQKEQ